MHLGVNGRRRSLLAQSLKEQLKICTQTLDGIKSKTSSSREASMILNNYLVS